MRATVGRFGTSIVVALFLFGCQTPQLQTVTSVGGNWEGPDSFELPRFRWSLGQTVVTRMTCSHDQGVEQSVTQQTVVRKHDDGLVEIVSETDGKEDMRFFATENGRITHATVTGEARELLGEDFVGRLGLLGEGAFQRLERNRPIAFRIPFGRIFSQEVATRLPGVDRSVFDGTLEYLGQTTFNDVRAAGYRTRTRVEGRLAVEAGQMLFSGGGDGISYFDVSSCIPLHVRMLVQVAMSIPGRRSETFRGECLSTLDRAASSGL